MSACGICGKTRRTGSGGRVMVLETGNIRCTIACAECMGRGVVFTTPPANLPTLTKAPLDADERDVRAVLRKLAKHLRGLAKVHKSTADRTDTTTTFEHADGLDQAADVTDAWAARPEARR